MSFVLIGLLALDKVYLHMNNCNKTLYVNHYWFCFIDLFYGRCDPPL